MELIPRTPYGPRPLDLHELLREDSPQDQGDRRPPVGLMQSSQRMPLADRLPLSWQCKANVTECARLRTAGE